PGGLVDEEEVVPAVDRRVVDEDVDAAEGILGARPHRRNVGSHGHVGVGCDRAAARIPDLARNLVRPPGGDVGDNDRGTPGGEAMGDDPADPPATARDDGRPAGEALAHPFSAPSWSPRMYQR